MNKMNIEVYGSTPQNPTLRLKLSSLTSGCVLLEAVDENGESLLQGNILTISKDGVNMMYCVNTSLGLPLGKHGQVVVKG